MVKQNLILLTSIVTAASKLKYLYFFIILDGFTHWSLTGTLSTDEDTFMGFNDGLSQSGTPACNSVDEKLGLFSVVFYSTNSAAGAFQIG